MECIVKWEPAAVFGGIPLAVECDGDDPVRASTAEVAQRAAVIHGLRATIGAASEASTEADHLQFGIGELDDRLAGGGLSRAALHEFSSSVPALAEDAATTLFVAGLAARLAAEGRSVLWALTRFDLYAPGLEQAGLGPDKVVFVEARDDRELLAAMEDGLRSGALAAVVGEARRVDMTATRRLQLAAAEGSTPALVYRRWRKAAGSPLDAPSSATTRWNIGCAPSQALGVPGVGRPRWSVELARQRNGNPFKLILEGCDAQGRLALPAASRRRAAASATTAIAA